MEFIKDLGFNPLLLGGQIVNFLIIYYLLKRFLYKPVLGLLKKREEDIKEGINKAEEGKKILEDALIKEKKILKEASQEAQKIIDDTKREADILAKRAQEGAKTEAQNLITVAREQIRQEAKEVEERLTKKVSLIAYEFLRKALSELVNKDAQKQIMQKAVKELKVN